MYLKPCGITCGHLESAKGSFLGNENLTVLPVLAQPARAGEVRIGMAMALSCLSGADLFYVGGHAKKNMK